MSEVKLDLVEVAGPRRRRSAQERVQIVEESFVHGMSVARVARKYGINANQVFQWRRMQQDGRLVPRGQSGVELLPARLLRARACEDGGVGSGLEACCCGSIAIELPGHVSIRLEGSVDAATVRVVLKSLRS